jgi:hypothetical protein
MFVQRPNAGPPRAASCVHVVLGLVCLALLETTAAHAAPVRAWMPPSADSLLTWATEARLRFQTNAGDSVGGENYQAYEIVARLGRNLLASMGRGRVVQARAIETVLDSLGLDTEVDLDPELPYFVLLMVRNPFKPTASSVGYLFWYRQNDLKVQGVLFRGGREPRMKVWWTGETSYPYEWGILDKNGGPDGVIGLTLLRLEPGGNFWNLQQFPADSVNLGGPGTATWADVNRDGVPEIVAWVRGELDPAFESCNGCPEVIVERTFSERVEGFQLEESRILPTAFSNFMLFVHMLRDGNQAGAQRLLADRALLTKAVGFGWNRKGDHVWRYQYGEPKERWPRWMAFSLKGATAKPETFVVRFGNAGGRWILTGFERAARQAASGPKGVAP